VSERLNRIIDEARDHLRPEGRGDAADWSDVDRRIFEQIAREPRDAYAESVRAAHARYRGSPRLWGGLAAVAAAAAVAFVVTAPRSSGVIERVAVSGADSAASAGAQVAPQGGTLAGHEGDGEVRVAGAKVEAGRALAVGDRVETTAARAFFQTPRAGGPGSVSWSLEERTHIEVRHAEGALVLALAEGAVEAQVTPVPNGEAFALDVGPTRVAVHGTHLRVARAGEHVTVDLSEGVVSIGVPPRSGSTYGTLVSAPAHVEFDAGAVEQTLRINHDAAAVRPPVSLTPAPAGSTASLSAHDPAPAEHAAQEPHVQEPPSSVAVHHPGPSHAAPSAPRVEPPVAEDPTAVVAAAVRACAGQGVNPADVRVTVSSKLSMQVGDDGFVHIAKFDPPLAPAAQDCAARVIYKTRFPHPGPVTIPIEIAP